MGHPPFESFSKIEQSGYRACHWLSVPDSQPIQGGYRNENGFGMAQGVAGCVSERPGAVSKIGSGIQGRLLHEQIHHGTHGDGGEKGKDWGFRGLIFGHRTVVSQDDTVHLPIAIEQSEPLFRA